MKKLLLIAGLFGWVSSALADGDDKLRGAKAKTLLRALKFAGVKPTKTKSSWTFAVNAASCHSAAETEDGLGTYDCQLDKLKISGVAAFALHEAMDAVGMPIEDGMSQTRLTATALVCVDEQTASGGAETMYQCTSRDVRRLTPEERIKQLLAEQVERRKQLEDARKKLTNELNK